VQIGSLVKKGQKGVSRDRLRGREEGTKQAPSSANIEREPEGVVNEHKGDPG